MSLLFSLLAFALILSPVVFIHELGHYLMARAFGVQVDVFSVGFGPSLWSYTSKKTGTLWKIGMIPLGGYAKFAGDENAASSIHAVVEKKDPRSPLITHKTPLQVALIGFAGPLANYILAFVLMFGVLTFLGNPLHEPVIKVHANSLAHNAQLHSGDRVVAFNNQKIDTFQDIVQHLRHTPKTQPLSLFISRQNDSQERQKITHLVTIHGHTKAHQRALEPQEKQELEKNLQPSSLWNDKATKDLPKESWLGTLGIEPMGAILSYERLSGGKAMERIFGAMNPWKTFSGMTSFQDLKRFKGPIGILEQAGDVMKTSLSNVLMFMASLSIGLGFFNLIPLPLLDGGRILMSAVEMIIGKSLSIRLQEILSIGAMIVLGAFFLYISWNDIMNLKALGPLLSFLGLKTGL